MCSKEDISNADGSGLSYNITPDALFKFKGKKCVGRKKISTV